MNVVVVDDAQVNLVLMSALLGKLPDQPKPAEIPTASEEEEAHD